MNFQANTKQDLMIQLDALTEQYQKVIANNSIEILNIRIDNKWSIFQNIDHINKSNRMTAIGFKTPKMALGVLFGKSKNGSRSTQEIIQLYNEHLKKGAKSPYILTAKDWFSSSNTELLQQYNEQISSLKSSIQDWSEEDLNRYCIKHPILGKITGLEMWSFTVYHQFHHMRTIQRILENSETMGRKTS
ncbi:MAG TPA: DinB family protein [Chitinophagales bacterium]|nr:DinB family protein [Chitinophagales bacterium]